MEPIPARDQMSRKRLASAVTCCDGPLRVADLRKLSFSCFTLVPVDAVGSPREVPEAAHAAESLLHPQGLRWVSYLPVVREGSAPSSCLGCLRGRCRRNARQRAV